MNHDKHGDEKRFRPIVIGGRPDKSLFSSIVGRRKGTDLSVAGLGIRALSFLIDGIVMILWVALAIKGVGLLPIGGFVEAALPMFIACSGVFLYFIGSETLWGKTLGKKILKLRVVSDDGGRCTLVQACIRMVCRLPDGVPVIGPVLIIITPQRKRLGDRLAKTLVIREPEE